MIKTFLTDLDGCLTDGIYYVSSTRDSYNNMKSMKAFNTRDFHGMNILNDADIFVGVLTASRDSCINNKVQYLPYTLHLAQGLKDKLQFVKKNDKLYGDLTKIAYIGDDVMDIPLLEKVGIAACPSDADPKVISVIENRRDGFVMNLPGGRGCVREFANMILSTV